MDEIKAAVATAIAEFKDRLVAERYRFNGEL